MLRDIELLPRKVNWASLVRHLLMTLGFNDVWLGQGVGSYDGFISILKQRLTDNFVQNWHSRLEESSRAVFYRSIASFQFQPYLEHLTVNKFSQALSKIRVSSHRLEIEAGRWVRPHSTPINDRKCLVSISFYHRMSNVYRIKTKIYSNLSKAKYAKKNRTNNYN